LKIILTYLLNIILYGIAIPATVFILASIAVEISCKYFWGEQYLNGDSGFKLGAWMIFYFITLTMYYYLFALINFGFSHRQRPVTVGITIAMPILFHCLISAYDFRITICFAGFHLTYYILFFGFVWVQKVMKRRIKSYYKINTLICN